MPRRIKVCQVLNRFSVGGAEMVALEIARGLDPDRFESMVLSVIEPRSADRPEMARRCEDAGIPVFSIHRQSFRDPRTLWSLFRFFREQRPDIIHGHQRFSDYWACRIGGWAGVPHRIWTRHSVYQDMSAAQIRRYRQLEPHTPVILAVSNTVRENCINVEGLPAAKVRTEVNGIDTRRFRPLDDLTRRRIRAELGVADHELMLLFVGRLSREKAPEAFPVLVRNLHRQGRPVRGFICGVGAQHDAVAAACVQAPVEMLGLRPDIPELLAACDLLVSTSRIEGLPLNIMEAMAAGRAFAGPDLGQVLELVGEDPDLAAGVYPRPSLSGEIANDLLEKWTEVIGRRLDDSDTRRRAEKRGREVICRGFSRTRMIRAHEDIYGSLLAGSRSLLAGS